MLYAAIKKQQSLSDELVDANTKLEVEISKNLQLRASLLEIAGGAEKAGISCGFQNSTYVSCEDLSQQDQSRVTSNPQSSRPKGRNVRPHNRSSSSAGFLATLDQASATKMDKNNSFTEIKNTFKNDNVKKQNILFSFYKKDFANVLNSIKHFPFYKMFSDSLPKN
jgi:hypothetical protein